VQGLTLNLCSQTFNIAVPLDIGFIYEVIHIFDPLLLVLIEAYQIKWFLNNQHYYFIDFLQKTLNIGMVWGPSNKPLVIHLYAAFI